MTSCFRIYEPVFGVSMFRICNVPLVNGDLMNLKSPSMSLIINFSLESSFSEIKQLYDTSPCLKYSFPSFKSIVVTFNDESCQVNKISGQEVVFFMVVYCFSIYDCI